MRLLRCEEDGLFSLTEYYRNIPRYAILSHTWGEDHEEVTFEDITKRRGSAKPGFQKLRFCADQAAKDNIQYIWVDTCCIRQDSSTELSEAINSRFSWYSKAAICYVYLTDLTSPDIAPGADDPCHQSIPRSRWFTRRWTLQELLAPEIVHFYGADGIYLGDKVSLLWLIQPATGIPQAVITGSRLSRFYAYDRISWSDRRQTKRPEDMVYCLLGICEVHMPLIYGEGYVNAYGRLQTELGKKEKISSFLIFLQPHLVSSIDVKSPLRVVSAKSL